MKKQNGITLIALVITIIVLLILAGVSIAMLTGDNGILTQATKAQKNTSEGEVADKINMALNGEYANLLADGTFSGDATKIKEVNGLDTDYTVTPGELTTDGAVLTITYNKDGINKTGTIIKDGTKYTITKATYPAKTTTTTPPAGE